MKVVQRVLLILLSCLYLWVGGAIVWHDHSHHEDCTTRHTHDHLPDEDNCSICFFLYSGAGILTTPLVKLNIFEKPFGIAKNDRIMIQYKSLVVQLRSNKDPPVLT